METLSFKITSDHFLLCLFLSLLWGITETTTAASTTYTLGTTGEATSSSETPTTSSTSLTNTMTPPRDAEGFKSLAQTETSITLGWKNVNATFNYTLVIKGEEMNVPASADTEVKHTIPDLTNGTKYNFQLFTVFEDARSTGVNLTAVTAPLNTENVKSVEQTETSITLRWKNVDATFNYTLVINGEEMNVPASADTEVKHTIPDLTNGTKYNFQLFTVFEYARSTGVNLTAVTAPLNAGGFRTVTQNETSITLLWDKVDDIINYTLGLNGKEIIVTATADIEVKHTIPDLPSGTKYNFQLFTVFEGVKSTGVNLTAVTAPLNIENVKSVEQTETSITLRWKNVDATFNYTLVINGEEMNVPASADTEVKHTIPDLTNGTKYNFQLFTVFEYARSSGVNLTAVTAPPNAENVKSVEQTETSITLRWKNVDATFNYTLVINGEEMNVPASADHEVKHTIPDLTNGTKYNFQLFTVFEYARSSGVNLTAVTAPPNAENVKSVEQTETSITLRWKNVDATFNYTLVINGEEMNVPASADHEVKHTIPDLTNGTKYNFQLFTVFEYARSSGVNLTAVTAPLSAGGFRTVTQNETSITLQWDKVDDIINYTLGLNGKEIIVTPTADNEVKHTTSQLTSGTKYNFQLFTVFEYARSSGVNLTAVTVPPYLRSSCEYSATGYSMSIIWNKPEGIWTSVEVNVTGKTHKKLENGEHSLEISGFLPARKYEVSIASVQSKEKSKAFPVAKFPDHFYQLGVDENRGFSQEYESLIPVGTDQTRNAATLPENKPRNRFNNVLPYDWCRVKLDTPNPNGNSDYINASYMPGYNSSKDYIACQGPLPTTVNHFWRMIWEQRVRGIVMVTNCTEGGRTKCEQYWPADREFRVKNRNNSEERTRTGETAHRERRAGAPTVVHCSAGVGRTGTIMALDVLLQQLEKERAVGINGFVHKMRLSRPHMVQTESQYVFLHHCIMDCLQPHENTEENIYENTEENIYENEDMIYANATALREFPQQKNIN
ncbi:hypothetical protein KUCAC02_027765 [Chaenocephalus aceratus]|uniref:Uncharacterized protein n=1 Tax=Chaenocephalus aceratus TaxID=36190 RepID=A0ACB9W4I9_CHAAC|nr:hypothetical protein KUCAC02_027765 [Chaenocephalus aceratus]